MSIFTVHKRAKSNCIGHHCERKKALATTRVQNVSQKNCLRGRKGTSRFETQLSTLFKDVPFLRIDRDSTQREVRDAKADPKNP